MTPPPTTTSPCETLLLPVAPIVSSATAVYEVTTVTSSSVPVPQPDILSSSASMVATAAAAAAAAAAPIPAPPSTSDATERKLAAMSADPEFTNMLKDVFADFMQDNAHAAVPATTAQSTVPNPLFSKPVAVPSVAVPSSRPQYIAKPAMIAPAIVPSTAQSLFQGPAATILPQTIAPAPIALAPSYTPLASTATATIVPNTTWSSSLERKRSLSTISDSVTEEQQEEARKIRNREHAKRSRLRKKSLTKSLEATLSDLKKENARMKQQMSSILGPDTVDQCLQEQLKMQDLLHLKHHRHVDDASLQFLRGLRHQVVQKRSRIMTPTAVVSSAVVSQEAAMRVITPCTSVNKMDPTVS